MDPGTETEGFRGKEGERRGNWVMGIKEGKCCDEHWVFYGTNELLNTTSKTNYVLYVG